MAHSKRAVSAQATGRESRELVHFAAESRIKRALDVVIALAVLLFIFPMMVLTAAAIWLESGGPILFRQQRTGLRGRPFEVYKFRSMTVMERGDDFTQARRDDPRITRVGAFLRRSSIDELPQLFNVLRGDMSLVGPRPHVAALDERFAPEIPNYHERMLVKPGMTGWAQIKGHRGETRDAEQMALRVAHDHEYVRRWSVLFDIEILVRTAVLLPFDQTAY